MGLEALMIYELTKDQAKKSAEAHKRQLAMQQQLGCTYSDPILKKRRDVIKCLSCGSKQFKEHNSMTVCSYCRSVQDGA